MTALVWDLLLETVDEDGRMYMRNSLCDTFTGSLPNFSPVNNLDFNLGILGYRMMPFVENR